MFTPLAAGYLADGPAMYFSGTIMTFALPMGAFIVITVTLFYLFRSQHSSPRLKYLANAPFTSFGTREPGSVQASSMTATVSVAEARARAAEDPETPYPETAAPGAPGATREPEEQ